MNDDLKASQQIHWLVYGGDPVRSDRFSPALPGGVFGSLVEERAKLMATDDVTGSADQRVRLPIDPPRSAEEAVTEALREAIREGVLPPGQRLAQAELAEQLGVSRIPLRDALRRLEAEALVRIDGRKGARVAELSVADVEEIYEMRIELEGRCVQLAVANLSAEDADRLVALGEQVEKKATSPSEGLAARRAFYSALYTYADRPRMHRAILQLRDNVARYHLLTNRELSRKAHSDLRKAILDGNATRAASVLREHLEEARDDLVARIEHDEEASSAS